MITCNRDGCGLKYKRSVWCIEMGMRSENKKVNVELQLFKYGILCTKDMERHLSESPRSAVFRKRAYSE